MAQTVIGFFEDNLSAYKAVDGLTSRGILANQIDITREEATDKEAVSDNRDGENGVTRFFKNLFGNSEEGDRYRKVSSRGYTMVTVHARSADEAHFAADLMDDFGALDIDEPANDNRYNDNSRTEAGYERDEHREASIQRIEEDVNISKRTVDRGGKRLRSRIVEKPVEEHIRLREEHVRVERNPVDRVASQQDLQSFQEGNIELTERKEIPVVNKEARVVEEIRLHKDVEERDETIHENLRHTEVNVDKMDKRGDVYNENRTFDQQRNTDKNYLNKDVEDRNLNDSRKDRKDGDPLFGA